MSQSVSETATPASYGRAPLEEQTEAGEGQSAWLEPLARLTARAAAVIGLYYILENWLRGTGHLGEASFYKPVLAIELGQALAGDYLFLALLAGLILFRGRALWMTWGQIENGLPLRVFIAAVALVLTWIFSTYDFNLYFNQAHSVDRVLLILLFGLLIWRPVFLLPFLALLFTIISQLDYPNGRYPWTEINLVVRVVVLFLAFFLFLVLSGRRKSADFFFLMVTLVASGYFWSGLGKLRLNWITHRHLNLLLAGSYTNGWLAFLPPDTIAKATRLLANLNWPLMIFTIVVELGSILALLRRSVLTAFLLGWIAFHLGIFAYTGMFFWRWIVLEVAILVLLLSPKLKDAFPVFTRGHFLLSLVLIGAGGFWYKPRNLSWFDTRLSYTYRFEAVGESGKTYELTSGAFAPYSDEFTLGAYLSFEDAPQLTFIYGIVVSKAHADTIMAATTQAEVLELESRHGSSESNAQLVDELDQFVRQFVRHWNERGAFRSAFSSFQPPRHLWSFGTSTVYEGQEPIVRVDVRQVAGLFDDRDYSVVRDEIVHTIAIQ